MVAGTIVYQLFLQLPLILRRRAKVLLCHHLLQPHRTAKLFLTPFSSCTFYFPRSLPLPPFLF